MNTKPEKQPNQDIAVEFLASESHLPINEVAQLYASELEKLAVGAHVTGFLPIFAIRNVREMLEQRAGA